MNIVLWIIQVLLGLLFLFAGASKFFMSADDLAQNMPSMSMGFLHFIGVCEALGGIGLIIPWVTKIKPILSPVAAVGLLIIMIGAVVVTAPMGIKNAVFPAIIGLLLAFVAWGRRGSATP
jgi:uncharacterized membrane protein YphA (DoxX/SURF4 family)